MIDKNDFMNHKLKIFLGFALGAATGIAIGMLLSPTGELKLKEEILGNGKNNGESEVKGDINKTNEFQTETSNS